MHSSRLKIIGCSKYKYKVEGTPRAKKTLVQPMNWIRTVASLVLVWSHFKHD